MDVSETIRLLDRLGSANDRVVASEALAAHFRAEALFVFIHDPQRTSKLIPAPGFRTVPSVRGWREFLARCVRPGVELGTVAYPDSRAERPACAYAFDGIVFVLVGVAGVNASVQEQLSLGARLISSMLRAEAKVAVAEGELEVERRNGERITSLALALDRARGDAERATRVKDEFLAMLGHELRNPLAPIVTALQMLRMERVNTRAQDVLERQVDHLMRLVDDLLDVSRITTGKIELRRKRVEIADVVTRALELSSPQLESKSNQLVVNVPERGLTVHGDPSRLAQIISNLVTNASKYSDAKAPIRLTAERVDASVRISVQDEGIGIEPAYVERVFEQFMQVPQGLDRAAGGLGLGLAIVRSLTLLHGGTVRAFSEGRGRGSTFVVELPYCATKSEETASAETATRSNKPARSSGPRAISVLIVDDNRDAAELLADALTAFGYSVRFVHTGPDALALIDEFTPAIAILDIGLPVMDGYELARALHEKLPSLRLVAVTGYGQANDRERAADAGFAAHLVKPVSISNVIKTLEQVLD